MSGKARCTTTENAAFALPHSRVRIYHLTVHVQILPISVESPSQCMKHLFCLVSHADSIPTFKDTILVKMVLEILHMYDDDNHFGIQKGFTQF